MRNHWRQSHLSARTAHQALASGDTISAISRAYYAMFDATRAALAIIEPELAVAKTHSTILTRFSKHIIKERGLDRKYSRMLRSTFELRTLTEYDEDPPTAERASENLQKMDQFIAAVGQLFPDELGSHPESDSEPNS